jgi:hypothetical protein
VEDDDTPSTSFEATTSDNATATTTTPTTTEPIDYAATTTTTITTEKPLPAAEITGGAANSFVTALISTTEREKIENDHHHATSGDKAAGTSNKAFDTFQSKEEETKILDDGWVEEATTVKPNKTPTIAGVGHNKNNVVGAGSKKPELDELGSSRKEEVTREGRSFTVPATPPSNASALGTAKNDSRMQAAGTAIIPETPVAGAGKPGRLSGEAFTGSFPSGAVTPMATHAIATLRERITAIAQHVGVGLDSGATTKARIHKLEVDLLPKHTRVMNDNCTIPQRIERLEQVVDLNA